MYGCLRRARSLEYWYIFDILPAGGNLSFRKHDRGKVNQDILNDGFWGWIWDWKKDWWTGNARRIAVRLLSCLPNFELSYRIGPCWEATYCQWSGHWLIIWVPSRVWYCGCSLWFWSTKYTTTIIQCQQHHRQACVSSWYPIVFLADDAWKN